LDNKTKVLLDTTAGEGLAEFARCGKNMNAEEQPDPLASSLKLQSEENGNIDVRKIASLTKKKTKKGVWKRVNYSGIGN